MPITVPGTAKPSRAISSKSCLPFGFFRTRMYEKMIDEAAVITAAIEETVKEVLRALRPE